MGRIKKWLRGVPMPAAFIICALICILAAFGLTKATLWFAKENISSIMDKYQSDEIVTIVPTDDSGIFTIFGVDHITNNSGMGAEKISTDEYQATISMGDLLGFNIYNNGENNNEATAIKFTGTISDLPTNVVPISSDEHIVRYGLLEEDQKKYDFYSGLNGIAAILWYSICLIIAAAVFYLWKIKKPFRVLNLAVQKISENDLNFIVDYDGVDEFGRLCQAFEVMRQELVKSNRKMLTELNGTLYKAVYGYHNHQNHTN